jgi:hypothetical protein
LLGFDLITGIIVCSIIDSCGNKFPLLNAPFPKDKPFTSSEYFRLNMKQFQENIIIPYSIGGEKNNFHLLLNLYNDFIKHGSDASAWIERKNLDDEFFKNVSDKIKDLYNTFEIKDDKMYKIKDVTKTLQMCRYVLSISFFDLILMKTDKGYTNILQTKNYSIEYEKSDSQFIIPLLLKYPINYFKILSFLDISDKEINEIHKNEKLKNLVVEPEYGIKVEKYLKGIKEHKTIEVDENAEYKHLINTLEGEEKKQQLYQELALSDNNAEKIRFEPTLSENIMLRLEKALKSIKTF